MPDKDWLDDYMDYKLSGCEKDEQLTDHSGGLPCVLQVLAVLWIVSKLLC